MLSSPVCDLAPELQTSEIPEGFMKHSVYTHICTYIYKNQSRRMRCPGTVARMGDVRSAYSVLVGRSGGQRPFGRRRWEDNIKIDLQYWEGSWIGLVWLRIGTGGGLL
jgi:hypothetical protein